MAATQEYRQIAVSTPLGKDVLLLQRLHGHESLSGLFEFTLDLLSTDQSIDFSGILGQIVTVEIDRPRGGHRYFSGYVSRFAQSGSGVEYAAYRATLRPWLWFLTRTSDCRIFQNQNVPDIIKQVFRDHGFTDFLDRTSRNYQELDYCVQYRETAFNFVSRLMEHEGIYYYFTHDESKHTLVLADGLASHDPIPDYETVQYFADADQHTMHDEDHISNWAVSQEIQSGSYIHTDFDFTSPRTDLKTQRDNPEPHAQANGDIFDYPGTYVDPGAGTGYARVRLEELQTQFELMHGAGDVRGLAPGALFTLANFPLAQQNRDYLVTAASYEVTGASGFQSTGGGEESFTCNFSAISSDRQFRPSRISPKPVVQGPQTAIVVGKSGEEIWTDKWGRVKIHFHWDRHDNSDENSSCWLRVAQIWAGKSWGGMFIPRIGQEVVVEFLEGDPDRPIVTGRVYNGDNRVPYTLPDKQTTSTIKSNSSKGGGGYNELRFDDTKGEEEIYMHAEKDFNRIVKHDDKDYVGNDQVIEIKNNRTETVDDGDEKVTISQGNRTVTVSQGNDTHEISQGDRVVKIDMGNDTLTVSMGNQSTKIEMGSSTTEAMQSIELKVGSSSVKIDQTGVTIQGMMITVNGEIQTQVQGGAMVQVQGGIVQIN